jgi:Zn-dependent M32 family carboxypeptidase
MKDLRSEYYARREGLGSMYDVQLADDGDNLKNIEHLIEHPEDIACTLVEIYSSADKCRLKIYDTVEECFKAFSELKKKENESRFAPSYERIVKLYRRTISIEDEIIIEYE